ncbi:MAG: ECF transporter S component [Lachnospiraceae bacterium]|nr:ECF transporter S component [Lachnospiraceae bacterium]
MNSKTKKLTTVGMLCAFAYVATVIGRVPLVLFLKYDPKDIIIAISGLIFGPLTSFSVALIVSLVEMFTISENGILGFLMNVISSCSFACTAAFIYRKKTQTIGSYCRVVLWVGLHGFSNAALELFNHTYLYGLSKRGGC